MEIVGWMSIIEMARDLVSSWWWWRLREIEREWITFVELVSWTHDHSNLRKISSNQTGIYLRRDGELVVPTYRT